MLKVWRDRPRGLDGWTVRLRVSRRNCSVSMQLKTVLTKNRMDAGMPKAMISQPMNGLTDEEIVATRNRAIEWLEERGYEVVNTLFTDEWYSKKSMEERGVKQIGLCFLAKSLENMSKCDAAFFCKGWENARGCKIEHDAAEAYGVTIIDEE